MIDVRDILLKNYLGIRGLIGYLWFVTTSVQYSKLYIQCLMEKPVRLLSLSQWPQRPPTSHSTQLSPITKRILSQIHLAPHQLLPLTFQQFLKTTSHSPHTKEQLEQYRQETQRRKKQVTILTEIRMNYILGKEYGKDAQEQKEHRGNRSRIGMGMRERTDSKEYRQVLRKSKSRSQSHLSRKISRVTSQTAKKMVQTHPLKTKMPEKAHKQREESDYFVNFDPRKQKVRINSNLKEEDSTKSHKGQKSRVKYEEHPQYGFWGTSNSKVRGRKDSKMRGTRLDSSRELCEELIETVQAWEKLDKDHMQEVEKMGELSARERERLSKMHSLEKVEMGRKMKQLKARLRSEGRELG